MDRTRKPRRTLKLKFKGKRPMGQPRTTWFSQVLEDMKNREKSWQEIRKERLQRRDMRLFIQ
jgi:hypothetical protein